MEISVIGPGQSRRIQEAWGEVANWLRKNARKVKGVSAITFGINRYTLRLSGTVTVVEEYVDRNGFYEIRVIGKNERALQYWRKILRQVAGYRS